MANPAGSFIWYELLTTDLEAASRFYETVVGLKVGAQTSSGEIDYRMISSPSGEFVGGAMQLLPVMLEHGARPGWFGYISVDDVDAAVAKVAAAGGKVQMPPHDIPEAGRISMVADPQGAPFYLMTPKPPAGQEDADSCAFHADKPGHVAWNELHARDGAEAFDFYSRQLGWERSDALDMGPMGTYQMFKPAGSDQAIGGMMTSPNMPRPMWVFYFNVDDIDAASERAQANGACILMEPAEIPGGFFVIQAKDPQDALFALVGPRRKD